jgi:hypothetical protein
VKAAGSSEIPVNTYPVPQITSQKIVTGCNSVLQIEKEERTKRI